jgi:hypothetical protein
MEAKRKGCSSDESAEQQNPPEKKTKNTELNSCFCGRLEKLSVNKIQKYEDELSEFCYEPDINDNGWICGICRKKIGCSALLDEANCHIKIDCILHELVKASLVSISNNHESEIVTTAAADCCFSKENYSQAFIMYAIAKHAPGMPSL